MNTQRVGRRLRAGSATFAVALAVAATAGGPDAVAAQAGAVELGGQPAVEVARFGAARVLESAGPPLFGRREFYRPVPPLPMHHRWIMVQDSTFGVVFTDPSGVKPDLENYDSDVYLRALTDLKAIELRALTFDVWGEMAHHLGVTVLMQRAEGESWDLHPRWRSENAVTRAHRTSIVWIHRVMFEDESILEADLDPVAAAWTHVTGSGFEGLPDDGLVPAIGP